MFDEKDRPIEITKSSIHEEVKSWMLDFLCLILTICASVMMCAGTYFWLLYFFTKK